MIKHLETGEKGQLRSPKWEEGFKLPKVNEIDADEKKKIEDKVANWYAEKEIKNCDKVIPEVRQMYIQIGKII